MSYTEGSVRAPTTTAAEAARSPRMIRMTLTPAPVAQTPPAEETRATTTLDVDHAT